MFHVLSGVWALLLGIVLIMLGNGMHFTLIGLRGGIDGFSATELAIVTSAYSAGLLTGARLSPVLIRRVGHVRVFAALGSLMSAGLIAFPLVVDPWAWTPLRLLVGFCMSGIYVTAESWLNDASTNETRGKVLSAYMIAQTLGIIGAQGLLTLGDAATANLFIGASILVSISFAPILLSASRAPTTEVARPMALRDLFSGSPLGTVGIFLLGAVYATQSGMGAVFGTQIGMTADQIALFVAMLFAGALVFQYPIGWLSDRVDRRWLIFGASALGAASCAFGWITGGGLWPLMASAFFAGGVTTPLYALFLAYTNDYLSTEDMPAASGGLVFTFGLGAILGPLVAGWAMQRFGPFAFWLVLGATFAAIALYALYRMTKRAAVPVDQTESYLGVLPTASPVAVEAAGAWAAEQAEADRRDDAQS
ncbi:MAG TPA: MFS transporter [Amaricoccus sp.]|uniref:MFS transporter n=1 Tax=Amaricoccus sp. TaxID=1872485 RepID=UPI002C0ACF61|nr:MFS transporter [Amaricoccus sp.]HMQ94007.1 MFS transporter [Amaricoccus sp.]HMR54524.1 MFS transporter [Amaricoccus sp.]HMR60991.1 MFS transporter [Amaricoccus sp.]HMU01557.1 MFS transporter [Amaricoccus sp.]